MRSITITTIAVSKNEIACDLQATHHTGLKVKVKSKIFKFDNPVFYPKPFFVGYSGGLNDVPEVLTYLNSDEFRKYNLKDKSTEFVVLTEDKKIFSFTDPNKWILLDTPYFAIGSGGSYAMGAFSNGASPKEAVQAAMKCDPMSGLGVKVFTF